MMFAATDVAFQGQGWGSLALQPVLAHCDAHRLTCYLENSKPVENKRFYESLGFRSVRLLSLGDEPDAPSVDLMRREPTLAASAGAGASASAQRDSSLPLAARDDPSNKRA